MSAQAYPHLKVFSAYTTLVPYREFFIGDCPVCDHRPPKMVVRPEQGLWRCYHCESRGDAVDFLQAVEQLGRDQAVLLYKMLVGDEFNATPHAVAPPAVPRTAPTGDKSEAAAADSAPNPAGAGATAASPPVAEGARAERSPERAETAVAVQGQREPGTMACLRERLGAIEGFRGLACFAADGKTLFAQGVTAEELSAVSPHFSRAFEAAQKLLGAPSGQVVEGVYRCDGGKFMRVDAPVLGTRCQLLIGLASDASEARFRMAIRSFLSGAETRTGA